MSSNPSYGFKVTTTDELPEKWQISIENTEHTANLLRCNINDIGMAVTFSAPQCPLSMACQARLCTQKGANLVGISIQTPDERGEANGPASRLEFERSMRDDRRPRFEHLVRIHWIKSAQK